MIVITGAAGFIGSCLVARLNEAGYNDLILVDDFSRLDKIRNLEGKIFSQKVERSEFHDWLRKEHRFVQFVFHIGARTDTTEFRKEIFDELNVRYSQEVWNNCVEFGLPLVYASSAATYGAGELGYSDDHAIVSKLHPLNPYGDSKLQFDVWALGEERAGRTPPAWSGFRFFNVYGPGERHKGKMASVVLHAFDQIRSGGEVTLFRSHKPGIADGEQKRDFVYVDDVVDVLDFALRAPLARGIYNLGTGTARTFLDLVRATFRSSGAPERIRFVDTPEAIRERYQYFTEARMDRLRAAGWTRPFTSLEDGVARYVPWLRDHV